MDSAAASYLLGEIAVGRGFKSHRTRSYARVI